MDELDAAITDSDLLDNIGDLGDIVAADLHQLIPKESRSTEDLQQLQKTSLCNRVFRRKLEDVPRLFESTKNI